ncbi:hypothetical protein EV213_106133 [Aureibacillus halotolerans]|uniref:Uncharacterized protein n=1 Tax=Aureibacillus halotolerans TaxID=1508390 RepID=A0A4R6U779_9BACI|nr:hypothetical protein EV213_106133 [Aureibacillus halotolerans]
MAPCPAFVFYEHPTIHLILYGEKKTRPLRQNTSRSAGTASASSESLSCGIFSSRCSTLKGIRSTSIREYLIVFSFHPKGTSATSTREDLVVFSLQLESTYVDYADVCFFVNWFYLRKVSVSFHAKLFHLVQYCFALAHRRLYS